MTPPDLPEHSEDVSAWVSHRDEAAARDGVVLRLITSRADVEALVPFVEDGNRAQFGDPAFVDELVSWVRFGKAEAAARRDGLAGAALGMPSVPRWVGTLVMKRLLSGEGEARRTAEAVRSSSALALFATGRNDRKGFVDLGRSFERLALAGRGEPVPHGVRRRGADLAPGAVGHASRAGRRRDEAPGRHGVGTARDGVPPRRREAGRRLRPAAGGRRIRWHRAR